MKKKLSRKVLSNAEYRLLGKGLNYCPKPKSHDIIQLKQDNLNLQGNQKYGSFFAVKASDEMIMRKILVIIVSNMSNATLILNQLLFSLLVEFYIDSITYEILQNDKNINSPQIYPQKN